MDTAPHEPDFLSMTDSEILAFVEIVAPDTGELFICAEQSTGEPAGYRVFRASHGFAVVRGDELRQIYTTPSHRRQGHGQRLLREVVAAVGTVLYLTCEPRHRAFFGRAGFRLAYGRRGPRDRKSMIRLVPQ